MLIDEMLEYCKNDYSNKNRACTDCNHHANVQAIVVYAFTKYTISIVILAQDTAIIADFSRITMYANTLSNTHQK